MPIKLKPVLVRTKGNKKAMPMTIVENPEDYHIVRVPGCHYPVVYKKSECEIIESNEEK